MKRDLILIAGVAGLILGGCVGTTPDLTQQQSVAGLSQVQGDSARYAAAEHPLRDSAPGTLVGDISQLDGSWGRYDRTGDGTYVRQIWSVVTFDASTGTFTERGVTLNTASEEPAPFSYEGTFAILSGNRIERTVTKAEIAAGLGTAGAIRIEQSRPYQSLVTVDGDYLMTVDGTSWTDPADLPEDQREAQTALWVRVPN